ncbi:MAG: hypothetical protein WA869_25125, partial [Alloacidobacterium sp.]
MASIPLGTIQLGLHALQLVSLVVVLHGRFLRASPKLSREMNFEWCGLEQADHLTVVVGSMQCG